MTDFSNSGPAPLSAQASEFLTWVVDHGDRSRTTIWGPYAGFDVHALAAFAIGRVEDAWSLLDQTLTMMEQNLAGERADPQDKWHLADFALHPMLRVYALFKDAGLERDDRDAAQWSRFERLVQSFVWHYGDLTENHNLLHAAGRLLVARVMPRAVQKANAPDTPAAEREVLEWMDRWFTRGSVEWGAELYYNVNLLALLNLHELGPERIRKAAGATLDLLALDHAVDRFGGAMCGSARRSYSAFRLDLSQNPSRPLHHIWFGDAEPDPPDPPDPLGPATLPFNDNFIGGAILAAVSRYRPPAAVRAIARDPQPRVTSATHRVGLWSNAPVSRTDDEPPPDGHLGRHTWRCGDAMLSVMNSYGGRGRYTEQVWQATLGERALVCSSQPMFASYAGKLTDHEARQVIDDYETAPTPDPTDPPASWITGNVPPGHHAQQDYRPGFWQGNEWGPRSFGTGRLAMLVYRIGRPAQLPFVHLYFPRNEFDDVRRDHGWTVARKDAGYLAVWCSRPTAWITAGVWADRELRCEAGDVGLLCLVGSAAHHGSFEDFQASLDRTRPAYHITEAKLSANCPDSGCRFDLAYEQGPRRNGEKIATAGPRFDSPWGTLATGERAVQLDVSGSAAVDIELPKYSLAGR